MRKFIIILVVAITHLPSISSAGYFPIFYTWDQPNGLGSDITLTYSYSNLLDGSIIDSTTNTSMEQSLIRNIIELALQDYAGILPIHFVEIFDNDGPAPESGEYNPEGLADIRIGHVPNIDNANAYAYFPFDPDSGLAGDVVFNANRFGFDWTETWLYAVAQHEFGHSLGMGHFINEDEKDITGDIIQNNSFYNGPRFPLTPDMVSALQGAYGAGVGSVTPIPLPFSFLMFAPAILTLLGFENIKKLLKTLLN